MASVRVEEGSSPYVEDDWDEVWARLENIPTYVPTHRQTMAERIIKRLRERAAQQKALAMAKEPGRVPRQRRIFATRPIIIGMGRYHRSH